MKLEVGKCYRTRNKNHVYKIVSGSRGGSYPFLGHLLSVNGDTTELKSSFTDRGTMFLGMPSAADLVEEVVEDTAATPPETKGHIATLANKLPDDTSLILDEYLVRICDHTTGEEYEVSDDTLDVVIDAILTLRACNV